MTILIVGLLISGRASPVAVFIVVPLGTALIAGFGLVEIGEFVTAGLQEVVSVTALIVFAILFFSVLLGAGAFEPIVNRLLSFAGENPVSIVLITAALSCIALDGDSSSTYLIVVGAMLPLYRRLGMNPLILTTVMVLTAGVWNMVPWGGPTARAATVVNVDPNQIWVPMIPVQAVGLLATFGVAYYLGHREKIRLQGLTTERAGGTAVSSETEDPATGLEPSDAVSSEEEDLKRPKLVWVNLILMVATLAVLITGIIPSEFVFMIALVLVLLINYPNPRLQMDLIQKYAGAPIVVASILLASGVFLGIGNESGMFEAITTALGNALPAALASYLPVAVGLLGTPLSLIIEVNAFYLGLLPILAGLAEQAGISPLVMAKASIIGHSTAGLPINPLTGSFYLMIALTGVKIGAHIRFAFPWVLLVGTLMTIAAVAFGQIPLP
jgi:CitMHS family citrate-Mg2+:H+ or citrate-Ca2+:H+ symporter